MIKIAAVTGLAPKYAAGSTAIFAVAFGICAALSFGSVQSINRDAQQADVAAAAAQVRESLRGVNQRILAYTEIIARKPNVGVTLQIANEAQLSSLATSEFDALKRVDKVVSTFELTDANGIVVMRGHNPGQRGDNKSQLKEIRDALNGNATQGLAVSPTTGQAAFDGVAPVQTNRGLVGTLKIGARASDALLQEIKEKTGADIALFFGGKMTVSTLGAGKTIGIESEGLRAAIASSHALRPVEIAGESYLAYLQHLPSISGAEGVVVATLRPDRLFKGRSEEFLNQLWIYALICLPLALLLGLVIGRFMARPLVRTSCALNGLARGESGTLVEYEAKRDEIGDMARAFAALRQEVLNSFKLRQTVSGMPIGVMTIDGNNDWRVDYLNPALTTLLSTSGMKTEIAGVKASDLIGSAGLDDHRLSTLPAEGVRTTLKHGERLFTLTAASILAPDGSRLGAMVAWEDVSQRQLLASRFESTVKGVVNSVRRMSGDLRGHAESVRNSAAATLIQAEGVARSSEENSASVTTVASAAEQLAASVEEIANQIGQSTEISREAAEQSRLMVDVVRDLQEAASRIGVVVQLIGNIASQTNLLALNATIEAARAGEAGRGFAVVASEVKALASQTAGAAEEVVTQVAGIQSKTGEAVSSIDRINSIIDTFSRLSTGVAAAVEQQRNATGEIARNTQQTASGTHEVAQTITHVSAATQETEQASQAMLTQADHLQSVIDSLNREVDDFLKSLAA